MRIKYDVLIKMLDAGNICTYGNSLKSWIKCCRECDQQVWNM
jgi:hypothetical protein